MEAPAVAMAHDLPDAFELWLGERPRWLQTAARNLIDTKHMPSEDEISLLVDLCKGEAASTKGLVFAAPQPGSLVGASARPRLRIAGLSNVSGVNAIKEGADLTFGDANITVIYGPNGSGKTGFARLLKHACNSRAKEEIFSNVFEDAKKTSTAKIHVLLGKEEHVLDWSHNGPIIKQLRDVHIFDSKSASMYVGMKNEATYEPRRMRFLSALITICDHIAACIDADKQALQKKIPTFPVEFMGTLSAKWLNGLKSSTPLVDANKFCDYPKELDDERVALEHALAQKDIAARLQAIAKSTATLSQVKTSFASLKAALSDNQLGQIASARLDAKTKRKTATEDAAKVFAQAPLGGVGQPSWMALWEQARKYSESHAYSGTSFPVVQDGSLCVLCQQELNVDGKQRLSHFEAFVKGGLEAEAKAAENRLLELCKKLPTLPQLPGWMVQTDFLKVDEGEAKLNFASLQARRVAADSAVQMDEIPHFEWAQLEQAITTQEQANASEEKALKELQSDGKRKEKETRVVELKATQWLNQNKQSIIDEISRLSALAILDKASALTKTNALTTKKNELAKQEVDAGYQTRFSQEIESLGGKRIKVKPESKQEGKGRISFGLSLQGIKKQAKAGEILSEGETRIVALSAFLADITGSGEPTPFIFDDPISSLDQDFEERVVTRLVELSKNRQVVVFTHRLSLLTLIETAVGRLEQQAKLEQVPPPVTVNVKALRCLGNAVGITHQLNMREAKPQKAANRLRDETIPQLRKLIEQNDIESYDDRAKSVCSDFRILVERCVEKILFNDVLQRFRRSVETKGKIGALAKITTDDCAFIDDLMTRYSAFEHSQPDELPAKLPEIDDLQADVEKLATWIADFEKRAIV